MYKIEPSGFVQEIIYQPPVNLRPEWGPLFRKDEAYLKVKLGVKELHHVFVNHYGLVLKNNLLVKGCAPNLGFSGYDESAYLKHWRKAVEQQWVSRLGKSIKSKRLDKNKTYLLVHSPWFSYYFWITECIPRLLMARPFFKEVRLIYPETWHQLPFVQETLQLFPELEWEVIPEDVHLEVPHLFMPEVKPWTPMFIPEHVASIRNLLFGALDTKFNAQDAMIPGVYISRKKAKRRKFDREDKAEAFFKELGLMPVAMEELSFFEQIALMRRSHSAAAITGAGLVNLLFKSTGGVFWDLTNEAYLTQSQYKFHYFKLCNILKIQYGVSFFPHESDPTCDHYSNQNLIYNESILRDTLPHFTDFPLKK